MSRRRSSQLIAALMFLALGLVGYFAFRPGVPLADHYEVRALVSSSNQLRSGSPVRMAGVDVGKVIAIDAGPGETTAVTMRIEDEARPLHTDATVRIRPRVFLEGGFYIELQAGSPSAPELEGDGTIPLPQTSRPVQFHQLLTVFEKPVREHLRSSVDALAVGLSGGGAQGLREAAPNLGPALRDIAVVAEAAQGTELHDVSELIAGASRVTAALAADRRSLSSLVTNLRITADALAADDQALAASISELDSLVRAAPAALRALDDALPVTERVAAKAAPALRIAPGALDKTADVLAELGSLVAPGARERTIRGLTTTFVDLPTLVVRMGGLFPTVKPLADCLRTHIVPTLNLEVPDGALSTGRPAWQDFAHSLVGLTSASQNFDANGYAIRYQFGGGPQGFSTDSLPGIGTLTGTTTGPLQSRPLPPAGGEPPIRRDVDCTTQPLPVLETPAGAG